MHPSNFISYVRASWTEVRKVVWPSRQDTLNTSFSVAALLAVVALFLFATDKSLEWAVYDLLLQWKH